MAGVSLRKEAKLWRRRGFDKVSPRSALDSGLPSDSLRMAPFLELVRRGFKSEEEGREGERGEAEEDPARTLEFILNSMKREKRIDPSCTYALWKMVF